VDHPFCKLAIGNTSTTHVQLVANGLCVLLLTEQCQYWYVVLGKETLPVARDFAVVL
jgi:hypothetical protein